LPQDERALSNGAKPEDKEDWAAFAKDAEQAQLGGPLHLFGVAIRLRICAAERFYVGTSANALKTQLWTALIAMLLVKYLQLRSTFGWSLSNLVALLRQQLFVYRDLWAWIDDPFQPPPIPEKSSEQLTLQLI
jgi:hypothetical protein